MEPSITTGEVAVVVVVVVVSESTLFPTPLPSPSSFSFFLLIFIASISRSLFSRRLRGPTFEDRLRIVGGVGGGGGGGGVCFFFFWGALEWGHPARRPMGGYWAPMRRGGNCPAREKSRLSKTGTTTSYIFRHVSCTAPRCPSRPSGGAPP